MKAIKPNKTRSRLAVFINILLSFLPLLMIWQLLVNWQIWPPSFLPAPIVIPKAFLALVTESMLIQQVLLTILRVVSAALIGLILGIACGVLVSINKIIYIFSHDLIDYLQAIGEIGWLPLLVLWSGFNDRTILIAIGYTVFFPIFYGTISGFRQVPENLINSVRTLGGNKKEIIINVLLPGALPAIITGFRTGMGFGWRTVILAEMLIAQSGLGVLLFNARQFYRVDWIIVGMIVAGLIWLGMDNLLLRPLEIRTIQRWGIQKKVM